FVFASTPTTVAGTCGLTAITAFTPGMLRAGLVSRLLIFAWAYGQRRMTPCSRPGRFTSYEYFARPVDLTAPSRREILPPIRRRFLGQLVPMAQPSFFWHSDAMAWRICS